ncbi:Fe2OG dioxygenase domain-containing protein [Citrus sinensis]|nr:Fe2OG dioxygenase domain-containing protein [Citrus sinensis]
MMTVTEAESYDRAKEVQQFEESKIGVNDSEQLRPTIVEKIARAPREIGFFLVGNHGIGADVLERVIGAVKGFQELPPAVKAQFYDYLRDRSRGVSFSNVDIFHSTAASWRDTLVMRRGPTLPELDEFPEIRRREALEWSQHVKQLGELLMGLLCEGLGLATGRMKEMTFIDGRMMIGNYYPYCPQPDLTVGIPFHTDPGALAILLQDHHGGLQCKCGDDWVDVKPVPGALVVDIGDVFQILSNDEYKSMDHRALANSFREARVSAVVFFAPSDRDRL